MGDKYSNLLAVVSSRWVGQGTYRGEAFNDDQRCGQTWPLTGTLGRKWQLLSEHCVRITPDSPPGGGGRYWGRARLSSSTRGSQW